MIKAEFYQIIYLAIVSILTIFSTFGEKSIDPANRNKSLLKGVFLLTFMILFIGARPVSIVFADMGQYANFYLRQYAGNQFIFNFSLQNVIYDNFCMWCACHNVPSVAFYTFIAIIYFSCIFLSCEKLFPNSPFETFLVYLAAFSTFSYATNGIKSGAAAAVFLVAVAYRKKVVLSLLLALISYGFHHSMQMVVASYIIVLFIKNPKYYVVFWCVSFVLAIAHITVFQELFAGLADDKGADYLYVEDSDAIDELGQLIETKVKGGYRTGLRLDFVLYSVIPIIVGWFMIKKFELESEMFFLLFNLYVLTNSIWLLCMYASYTNRIAYLSWFLYPFVLIYPFVKFDYKNKLQFTYYRSIVLGHLCFTLFMLFFYYG